MDSKRTEYDVLNAFTLFRINADVWFLRTHNKTLGYIKTV